ncbi:MAG: aconitase X, partial [Candidatus Bathyarchaeia archaeon]
MYLTPVEERMLSGEMGEPIAAAMRLLTTLGDVFGAKRMTRISSAHISGVSYQNIGDPGLEFLEGLTASGARIRIKATITPSAMDRNRWRESGVPEKFAAKQLRILRALEAMGAGSACTCTPYLAGNKPSQGE